MRVFGIMSPEAQRIAIAEACGWRARQCGVNSCSPGLWRIIPPEANAIVGERFETKEVAFELYAPDYLSDLNAMHEAEKTLSEVQGEEYVSHLGIQSWSDPHWFAVISATAAQRAEAFLKTIGKWTT